MIDPFEEEVHADPTHFPADLDMEQSLLGSVLVDPDLMDALDFLVPGDFYESRHRDIFQIMRDLREEGSSIDSKLIADRDPVLRHTCLMSETMFVPAHVAKDYARQVRALAQKRQMLPMAQRIAEMSSNGASPESILDYMQDEIDQRRKSLPADGWTIENASDLDDLPKSTEWGLEGLIALEQTLMWFGPPGIKKTLLLIDMCAAMAAGQHWLVRRSGQEDHESLVTFRCTKPRRILWLDYDNGKNETRKRIRAAFKARGNVGRENFFFMSETVPWLEMDNAAHIRKLIKLIIDHQIDVVVIDALGLVLGGIDENSPEVAKVVAKIKELRSATGAAVIAVHHPSKSGARTQEANGYNASGHAKFINFFELAIELRSENKDAPVVAEVVKNRVWVKAHKFSASLAYKHFDAKDHPDLAHELESFEFYPEPIVSESTKKSDAIRLAIAAVLQGEIELNQAQLVEAAKAEAESATRAPVGAVAIRVGIKAMTEDGTLKARPTGERRPVFYSLAMPVDQLISVDSSQ
jgi:replicative DNA helicase